MLFFLLIFMYMSSSGFDFVQWKKHNIVFLNTPISGGYHRNETNRQSINRLKEKSNKILSRIGIYGI